MEEEKGLKREKKEKKEKRSLKERIEENPTTYKVLGLLCLGVIILQSNLMLAKSGSAVVEATITQKEYRRLLEGGKIESATIRGYDEFTEIEVEEGVEVEYKEGVEVQKGVEMKSNPRKEGESYREYLRRVVEESKGIEKIQAKLLKSMEGILGEKGDIRILTPQNEMEFIEELEGAGVEVKTQKGDELTLTISAIVITIISMFQILFYIGFIYMVVKSVTNITELQKKGKVSKTGERISTVKFEDVAGLKEEKEELKYAVMSLKEREKFKGYGCKPVKGILLEGSPGVGKTLLAKAVAGESGVPFISVSGSDFVEMYVGLGAKRVREVFKEAREKAPCVLFIDELDAIGKKRGYQGSHQEMESTLIALLEQIDGVESLEGVLLMGATNRADVLDEALKRPGRFDKVLHIRPPRSKEDMEEIIKVHLRDKRVEEGLSVEYIGKELYGLSGAEISSVLNDSVIESIKREGGGEIGKGDIEKAVMKYRAKGLQKGKYKSEEKERVAIHEAGHAVVMEELGHKLIKVSIQAYSSGVGGYTQREVEEKNFKTKKEIEDEIKMLYGGLVAEELLLGGGSTGARNDLERATLLIDELVSGYGLEEDKLIVRSVFVRREGWIKESDEYIEILNKEGMRLKREVEKILREEGVQKKLRELAGRLIDEEVVYFQ